MTKVATMLLLTLLSYASLNAQLVGVTSANSNSFCDSSCDTLELTVEVYFNGQLVDPPVGVGFSWTGPNGYASNEQSPRIPITSQDQIGDYCVVLSSLGSNDSQPDCQTIDVVPTVDWTCPETVMVTGVDCSTDLVDYNFTVNMLNCPPDPVDYSISIFVDQLDFYSETGQAGSGDQVFFGIPTMVDGQLVTIVDSLPYGTHELITTLTDPQNPSKVLAQCESELRVVESINNVACNDRVNITLDEFCTGTLTPQMILQGDYCYDLFILDIDGYPSGNTIILDAPGEYVVTATGASGISCWGTIFAEDKSVPELDCEDFDVYCSGSVNGDFTPGQTILGFSRRIVEDITIDPNDSETITLFMDGVEGVPTSIEIQLHAEIPDVNDLWLELTDPSGTITRTILNLSDISLANQCTESNINVCLRDDAENSHADFGTLDQCRSTLNAFIGEFRPLNGFNQFNSAPEAFGDWELTVYNESQTDPMTLVSFDFRLTTIEGSIPTQSEIIIQSGCSNPQVDGPFDEDLGLECENGLWNVIERTWIVTNNVSGLSATCTQNINLLKWTVDDIIWPKSYDDLELPVIECWDLFDPFSGELDESLVTADTIPTPAVTGRPRVPFGEVCGNFQMTHNDLKFKICGKYAAKVIRTWSVLDWCTGDLVHYEQVIKIEDDQPIEMTCQPDNLGYTIFTNSFDCTGDWDVVPPLSFSNSCDANIVWDVAYLLDDDDNPDDAPVDGVYIQDNVEYINGVPFRITDLPSGRRTWIRYTASDDCGNTGECFTEVDVEDDDLPHPVCIEYTVVALSNDGCAKLHAESLDNGSWDNCGIESFHIRRQNTSQWVDYVEYCCACTIPNEMVYLRVTDINGNTNSCQVEVEIQDNLDPVPIYPSQSFYEFNCMDGDVDVESIINQTLPQFGYTDNCDPNNDGTFFTTVEWTRSDGQNISAPLSPGDCGEAGLTVNYTIFDECGDQIGSWAQNISIRNFATTFVVNWPQDPTQFLNCSSLDDLHPDNLGAQFTVDFNDVNTFQCNSNLAITWDDLVFEDVEDACLKILRTWTVVDWCLAQRFGLNGNTQKSHTQVLKVNDITPPTIDVDSSVDIDATTDACQVSVQDSALVADITDVCTDLYDNQDINAWYEIDYADGGSDFGVGNDARRTYPFGTSTITWYAEDHCGNIGTRTTLVRVNDVKPPTPYCLGVVVTATMTENGPVAIWASDFNLGGFDNYTGNCNSNALEVYFLDEGNNKVQSLEFDCDDIPDGIEEMVLLNVYYEDEAGNVDYCVVTLLLQDNVNDSCPDVIDTTGNPGSMIAGLIETEFQEAVRGVKVDILSNSPEFHESKTTDYNGEYAFEDLLTGRNYYLNAEMDGEPLNGVSTLDLLLIQRHILGVQKLDSPFKLIAADADNSNNISATDLITLRKLILGVYNDFPNGQTAWRFPEKNQYFTDPKAPFPYNEQITVVNMGEQARMNQDFVAVKIGDVNASVQMNVNGPETDNRNANSVVLEVNEQSFGEGELINVAVYSRDLANLAGFQNTFNFDTDVLEFAGVVGKKADVTEENLGLYAVEDGMISFSWHTTDDVEFDQNTPLFELQFVAQQKANLSEAIYISSMLTKTEAYSTDLEIFDVNLNFRGVDNSAFTLYQNIPNPFTQTTEIRFNLPEDSEVLFSVYDVSGRQLMQQKTRYSAGEHSIILHRDDLQASGVMYYTMETGSGFASKKMIQIK
ncbi:MAG: T9SS type A sorting domain-containing protein [Saprospiraceae bacterium]|nr:T9SS type A sorting domain-containing protein [Saprospiraceae bacterium]